MLVSSECKRTIGNPFAKKMISKTYKPSDVIQEKLTAKIVGLRYINFWYVVSNDA